MPKLIEYKDMTPRAKAVVEGIARGRDIKPADINNVWKALARDPDVMERFAEELKAAMGPGKLDPLTKELVYLAVSIANQCDYCIASHGAMAAKKGLTEEMHSGVHGRRAGGAKGQQDRRRLSCARRCSVRGEVIVASEASTKWDANLYLKFADHAHAAGARPDGPARSGERRAGRPRDLRSRLRRGQHLAHPGRAFPESPIVGIDSSEEMLAKARSQTADPRVTFAKGDLAAFKPGLPPSILYSNAAYQWVEGHIDLFPGLLKLLPSGGQLAIQMPRNHEAPSHALMRTALEAGPWKDKVDKVRSIRPVFEPRALLRCPEAAVLRSRSLGIDLPAAADRQGSGGAVHGRHGAAALHGGA